jgi:hypothetical protein
MSLNNSNETKSKNLASSIFFRFIFLYLILYILPFPFSLIPFSEHITTPLHNAFVGLLDVTGPLLLNEYYNPLHGPTGSGDTSLKYTEAFILIIFAGIGSIIWTLILKKDEYYTKLSAILEILVRYYLAATLFGYGFSKVIPLQFSLPNAQRLNTTYGESSLMGLAWTFMGSSPGYTILSGCIEVVAGIFLLFHRTRLLGAIVSVVVFINVFALNIFYNIPVKLFSLHLLLMSVLILAMNAKRLLGFFFLNSDIAAEEPQIHFKNTRRSTIIYYTLNVLLVGILILPPLVGSIGQQQNRQAQSLSQSGTIMGEYTISHFLLNGDTASSTDTNTRRWKSLKISGNILNVTHMDGFIMPWYCSVLNNSHKIRLSSKDLTTTGEFDFKTEGKALHLSGYMNQDTLNIVADRTSDNPYLLLEDRFQWISEEPFYR